MQRFNEAYVSHLNAFTGLRYKDDPAIIAMLLTNENDVTHHFGNALLPDKNVPRHNAIYMAQASNLPPSTACQRTRLGGRGSTGRPSCFSMILRTASTHE